MQKTFWALAMVLTVFGAASAEIQSGPAAGLSPTPDAEGTYFVGPQVTAPRLLRVMRAGYPAPTRRDKVTGFTVLSMVIAANGRPTGIEVLHTHGDAYDGAATEAVKQSTFAPGFLAAKPVPVRIDVRVSFHQSGAQAVPVIVIAERDLAPPDPATLARQKYTPPIPIHTVDADFFDPTVKLTYETIALVTVDVDATGMPTNVRMRRGLGFGTDAKALAAVKQYRFLPATSKGKPIAASREVEVKFAML